MQFKLVSFRNVYDFCTCLQFQWLMSESTNNSYVMNNLFFILISVQKTGVLVMLFLNILSAGLILYASITVNN